MKSKFTLRSSIIGNLKEYYKKNILPFLVFFILTKTILVSRTINVANNGSGIFASIAIAIAIFLLWFLLQFIPTFVIKKYLEKNENRYLSENLIELIVLLGIPIHIIIWTISEPSIKPLIQSISTDLTLLGFHKFLNSKEQNK